MRIGLIVNPVAGLGGAVGLKGTDGPDTVAEALRLGAVPQSGPRARSAMARLAARVPGAKLTVAPHAMGADWADGLDLTLTVAHMPALTVTSRDTRNATAVMLGCDLIVFAGGDGTARDVTGVAPSGTAVLGIPCGVKMHSGVFAISPEAAGAVLADLIADEGRIQWDDAAEVMDIDEEELRAGRLAPRLFGLARVPQGAARMQAAKGGYVRMRTTLAGAAAEVARSMVPGTLLTIGPGTSAGTVMQAAGHTPTLLGTDALLDSAVVARDARAADLEALARGRDVRIILGVTGQQGFVLGRGNQTISAALIAQAGLGGLVVLATDGKLAALAQAKLWVDTGDPALDTALSGYVRVRTGSGRRTMMKIGPAE